MLSKVRTARAKLHTLLSDADEAHNKHPFRKAGVDSAGQVTMCFVVLRKHSDDALTLGTALDDENRRSAIPFNVVLLDDAALVQHYGDTLAPSVALCEHALGGTVCHRVCCAQLAHSLIHSLRPPARHCSNRR